jgi:hypothetical protein
VFWGWWSGARKRGDAIEIGSHDEAEALHQLAQPTGQLLRHIAMLFALRSVKDHVMMLGTPDWTISMMYRELSLI